MSKIILLLIVTLVFSGCTTKINTPESLVTQEHQSESLVTKEVEIIPLEMADKMLTLSQDFDQASLLDLKQRLLTQDIFVLFNTNLDQQFFKTLDAFKERYQDYSSTGQISKNTYYEILADTDLYFANHSLGDLVVVNKQKSLTYDYVPEKLRVPNVLATRTMKLKQNAAKALEDMFYAAKQDGITLVLTSAYRDFYLQAQLFEKQEQKTGSFSTANEFVALPGESEHQTGLVVDITADSVGRDLVQSFENTKEFAWLYEHAKDYGFILRYPKNREQDTGYAYEPWHYRYVGSKEVACQIMDNHLILEEYIENIGKERSIS